MTSDQFYVTSYQFEKSDDQKWSQKPQDPSHLIYRIIENSKINYI